MSVLCRRSIGSLSLSIRQKGQLRVGTLGTLQTQPQLKYLYPHLQDTIGKLGNNFDYPLNLSLNSQNSYSSGGIVR